MIVAWISLAASLSTSPIRAQSKWLMDVDHPLMAG
jgi:hypothetical protein